MSRLKWQAVPHEDLALLLKECELADSRAVGASTVYQISRNGQELLAVSLPDGQAVVVEICAKPHTQRRHIDPVKG